MKFKDCALIFVVGVALGLLLSLVLSSCQTVGPTSSTSYCARNNARHSDCDDLVGCAWDYSVGVCASTGK